MSFRPHPDDIEFLCAGRWQNTPAPAAGAQPSRPARSARQPPKGALRRWGAKPEAGEIIGMILLDGVSDEFLFNTRKSPAYHQ
jgi:hypothetical protein